VRKLFGSNRKGKRLLDKAVKEGRSRDENTIAETPDHYSVMEELPGDISITEMLLAEVVVPEEQPVEVAVPEELPVEDVVPGAPPVDPVVQEEQPADAAPEEQPTRKSGRKKRPLTHRKIIYALMIVVGLFFAAAALRVILSDVIEDAVARDEYERLRDNFPQISGRPPTENEVTPDEEELLVTTDERELRDLSLDELAAINGDFIGWINANNNAIDYPIVRGNDNEKYIHTTFFGSSNSAGTIFMDHRHARDFNESIVILYGHHTRDGSMFTSLVNHLDADYRSKNPYITITTRDGRKLNYAVFAAKLTNAWDPAYATVGASDTKKAAESFPNAPANAVRYLLLSTCTRNSDEDERILVFAALF